MIELSRGLDKGIPKPWKRWVWTGCTLLPIAALALYSYVVAASSVRKLVRQNNEFAAGTTAVLIDREFTRSIAFATTLASLPGTIELVQQRDEQAMSDRLKAVVQTYDGIDRATLSDMHGIMWSDFPSGGEALGMDISQREWFQGVVKTGRPFVTGLYRRLSDQQRRVAVVAAPINKNGVPLGVIAIHYRLETLASWLQKIRVGEDGNVMVLDSKGAVVIHPSLDMQAREYDDYASLDAVRKALNGTPQLAQYSDPLTHTEMVASLVPVQFGGTRWVVVAQQPSVDAYAPLRSLKMEIAIAGTIVALLAFLAASSIGRFSSKVGVLNAELNDRNLALARLALIVQSSNDAILSTALDGTIASWNPGAERMFGYSASEAIGRSASIYIPRRLCDEMDQLLKRVRAGERIEQLETIRQRKDGRELNVSLSIAPLRSADGTIDGTTTIARDVTEQRRAETALRESMDRFSLVASGTNDGLWDWNIATNEVYFSPRWKEMLGYADNEIQNHFDEWEKRLHPDDHDRALATVSDYLENRTTHYELEHRMRHKDGEFRWFLARGRALRDPEGKAYRMVGSYLDLTERKRVAEQLALKAKELSRSNAELEQFAYVASHDLREPLRMIGSFGNHLAKRNAGKLDSVSEAYLNQVLSGAERMKALIDDLLEFSRVGIRGKPFEPVDCNTIFAQARENLQVAIEETGGTIVAASLPTVSGDGVQLTQVFQNLIGNALKFKGAQAPRIEISCETRDRMWRFSVKDNGIGIEPQHFKRIFAIFARLHTREEYPGTGIGLALCKRIVERHGGMIWLESESGKGTTFFFTIPDGQKTAQTAPIG